MRRRIHLHGAFKGFHDGPIEIEAETVWEAIEAMTYQVLGFAPDAVTGRKRLKVVGYETIEKLKAFGDKTVDIHVLPALMFGKDGGLIQTVVGVALIVAGLFMPPGSPWQIAFISAGLSFTIGGVMQMISPQPQLGSANDSEVRSKYLGGITNTVKIGTPIALLYGEALVGGHIMSLNIDATDTGL